jgi:hypothetical protein
MAEELWDQARMLFLKSGKHTDFRGDQSKLYYIYTWEDAYDYVSRIFDWAGALSTATEDLPSNFVREVLQCNIEVASVYTSVTGPLWHQGEGTVHNPELVSDWERTFRINELKLAQKYNMAWYEAHKHTV